MFILKFFRKFGKLIRGGSGSRELLLGALLGAILGMIPGANLTLLLGVALLLILNANVGLAVPGFAMGKVLCLLAAPVTFEIGYCIIHRIGIEGVFRTLSSTPVLALMDLHVYCLIGGIPVAIVVGLGFGLLMLWIVNSLRKGIILATERSKTMEKLSKNKLVRALLWLVFGSAKGAPAGTEGKRSPVLRKGGVIFAVVFLGLFALVEFLVLDYVVKYGLERGLGSVNGAEVNVGSADLSLTDGRLELSDIQVTDRDKPANNVVQIDKLAADLSIRDLLTKRITIDLIEGDTVRRDVKRSSPGTVFVRPEAERPSEQPEDALGKYFENIEKIKQYLSKLKEHLERKKAEPEKEVPPEEKLLDLAANEGYLSLSARHILAEVPTWTIRKISVNGIYLKEGDQPNKLEASELSSDPELNAKPSRIKLAPADGGEPVLAATLNFDKPDEPHKLEALRLDGISIGESMTFSDEMPVNVNSGTASVKAAGLFTSKALNIPFSIAIDKLKADAEEGKPVLGLDPKTAGEAFKLLDSLTLTGSLLGSIDAPRLKLDKKQLLASLKEALVKAGKAEIAGRVNAEIDKVKNRAKDELDKALKDNLPIPRTGDLLPGIPGDKKDSKKDEDDKKPDPGRILKDLF